jgi:peptidoglycan/xylan/chitin deacetylase (PgdA/CDA1 family)
MKRFVFALLEAIGANALSRRLHRGKIKVLLYHNVVPERAGFNNAITPEEFEAQLRYLKARYNVIGLDQAGEWQGYQPHRVNVLVTFDDGFINNLEIAAPILRRNGVPAVFFLIADRVEDGGPPSFAERYGDGGGDRSGYATIPRDRLNDLLDLGITIGSHSLRHDDLSLADDEQLASDLRLSRAKLEALCGREVAVFAFPWGKHRRGQEAAAAKLYARVFLTEHGFCAPQDRVIPRNEVMGLGHLQAAASGTLDFLKRALPKAA